MCTDVYRIMAGSRSWSPNPQLTEMTLRFVSQRACAATLSAPLAANHNERRHDDSDALSVATFPQIRQ